MQDSSHFAGAFGHSFALRLTGQLMVIAILVLVLVVIFVILLHLYAKFFWLPAGEVEVTSETRWRLPNHRSLFAASRPPTASKLGGGLDLAVLNSLPVMEVGSDDFKDGMKCSVCLSDIVDGERARVLPKCNHGFHLDCIDMWFQFHSTCPLCRNIVAPDYTDSTGSPLGVDIEAQTGTSSSPGVPSESPNMPTNVLFWGNQGEESPSSNRESNGSLVIEIPNEASPPTSSSSSTSTPTGRHVAEEEAKSPAATRLRSLKMILTEKQDYFLAIALPVPLPVPLLNMRCS